MSTMKPFRFGAQLGKATSGKEWVETARTVEDLGYSTLSMPDHFDDQLAPMPALMAAAAATTSLRVGSLVFDNDYKHPLVLAKEAATLDLLCDGRLELGVGAGWLRTDYEQAGMPYDRPGVRIERFEEGLEVIKGVLSCQPFSFEGTHYTITGHTGTPKPVQQPRPPILIGAGARRMMGVAGRHADIVSVNFDLSSGQVDGATVQSGTREATVEKLNRLRQAAGDRFDDIEIGATVFVGAITDDPRGLAATMAPGFGVTPEQALEIPHFLAGSEDSIVESLQQRREEYGISYIAFSSGTDPSMWRDMGPVVARLAGS